MAGSQINATSGGFAEDIQWFCNPFDLSIQLWTLAVVLKSVAVLALDQILFAALRYFKCRKMPTREPKIAKGLEKLERMDYTFIVINQTIETVFVVHLLNFIISDDLVVRAVEELSLLNTILPMYLIFLMDDFMYYFTHRLMHHPLFYQWCHKHHHRQSIPFRGYMDAANESPIEQVLGLSAVWIAVKFASRLPSGLHAVGIVGFFAVYAATAFLNHTDYDLQPGVAALGYTVRAHEMHHRFPNCNYAQNVMLWDKLFGTYAEYKGQSTAKVE